MLICTPKDRALCSIRRAMSHLFQANKGLLAHKLVNQLDSRVCDTGGSKFYPSSCNRTFLHQVTGCRMSREDALRTAVRHLWDACFEFEAAGMPRAAYVCLVFGDRVVIDELLTAHGRTSGTAENL